MKIRKKKSEGYLFGNFCGGAKVKIERRLVSGHAYISLRTHVIFNYDKLVDPNVPFKLKY